MFLGSGVKEGACPDGGRVIDALFFSRITFSFFEATSVHGASDAATMMAYAGCYVGSGTGNRFLEHWRTKLQMLVKLTLIARQGHQKNSENKNIVVHHQTWW